MTAVADALYVSTSAISKQISHIEQEAGVQLLERHGRQFRLTEAGDRLVMHAERIMGIIAEAETDLAELRMIVAGELRLAAFPSVASTLIPVTIRKLGTGHPRLRVVLTSMEATEGLAALLTWQTDIAIIDDMTVDPSAINSNVESTGLYDDRLYAVLPTQHPLAKRNGIGLDNLSSAKWALDVASTKYFDAIVGACRSTGFEPAIVGYCNGSEVVTALIGNGCVVSVMPGLSIRNQRHDVAIVPIIPEMRRRISAAYRRGETRNPAIAAVLRALRNAAGETNAAINSDELHEAS